jgi:type IV secretion system protein TrbE
LLKEFRSSAHGLPDLLAYALEVEQGILLLKSGAFLAAFRYQGDDLQSASPQQLEWVSASVHHSFCQLGDGWMIHADLIRKPICQYASGSDFPDATSKLIDAERKQQYLEHGAHFESESILTVTYQPPADMESRLKKYFVHGHVADEKGWEQVLHFFTQKLESLELSLSKCLRLHLLKSDALLTHLHTCITGLSHRIKIPQFPIYLDALLGSQDVIAGLYPRIGNQYIRVIWLSGFPLESEPGILKHLEALAMPFRWSNRFIFLDPLTATQILKRYRRNWFQKRHGLLGLVKEIFQAQETTFPNQDALEMTQDADQAICEMESGLVRYGYYTPSIILMDESLAVLEQRSQLILKQLEAKGFSGRIETINAMEAYLGSLPGEGYRNIRKPIVHTLNLADFLPLTGTWAGLEHNPCPYYPDKSPPLFYAATTGATPFRLNLHVGDVGHTAIFGETGAGKSTLIGLIVAQHFRYPNAQVFLFDKGYSSYVLCRALGGAHYDLLGSQAPAFYPLANIHQHTEFYWANAWLEILLAHQGLSLLPEHRQALLSGLLQLTQKKSRTFTDLQSTVQHPAIKEALEFYTLSGALGSVFDADNDDFRNASQRLHVFEMQHLLEKGNAYFEPVFGYLFHQVENSLAQHKPSLIIIEEGHAFLKGHFGLQLNTWLRECRKRNAAVVFVTQNLSEVLASEHKHILLNSCKTKLFLPNAEADSKLNQSLYAHIGLAEQQIQLIQQATPKRDYYYTSPLGRRLIDLDLGEIALSFMGVDGELARHRVDTLMQRYGREWVYHWLQERGLSVAALQWQTYNLTPQDHSHA